IELLVNVASMSSIEASIRFALQYEQESEAQCQRGCRLMALREMIRPQQRDLGVLQCGPYLLFCRTEHALVNGTFFGNLRQEFLLCDDAFFDQQLCKCIAGGQSAAVNSAFLGGSVRVK